MNLRGREVRHVHLDPPLVLAGMKRRPRDVGLQQRSRCVPRPGPGCQTPLEPVHAHPPRVPRLQERQQASILIEKPAGLPPCPQGVPGAAAPPTWRLRPGLLTHLSKSQMKKKIGLSDKRRVRQWDWGSLRAFYRAAVCFSTYWALMPFPWGDGWGGQVLPLAGLSKEPTN